MSGKLAQTKGFRRRLLLAYALEAAITVLLVLFNVIQSLITTGSVYIVWGMWAGLALVLVAITSLFALNQFLEAQGTEVVRSLGVFRLTLGLSMVVATLFLSGAIPELIDRYYREQDYLGQAYPGPMPEGTAITAALGLLYVLGLFLLMLYKGRLMSTSSMVKLLVAIVVALPLLVVSYFISFAQNYRF